MFETAQSGRMGAMQELERRPDLCERRFQILRLLIPVLAGLVALQFARPALAAGELSAEPTEGASLCLPGVYLQEPESCLPLGPSAYQTQFARAGLELPIRPLPVTTPDRSLTQLPYYYGRLVGGGTPVYGSLEAAIAGDPAIYILEEGFDFITYIEHANVDGRIYYMIAPGVWVRGDNVSRYPVTPTFQGVQVYKTPTHPFGWVLFETESKRTPGYGAQNYTGNMFYRFDLVHVYEIERIGDVDWYMIGPEEWLEGHRVALVIPNTTPPEGIDRDRWIEVNLAQQTLAVYENRALVFATLNSTGVAGTWTQPGTFQIYQKLESTTMQGSFTADRSDYYYLEDVPWTMYFDQARALHGAYWHNGYGVPRSRGCVNLSPGDARWLFEWAEEGDWVYVWDPTGKTPTDPALYGSGGA